MLIIKLILQFLAVGIALLTTTLDYVVRDKRTRSFKRIRNYLYGVAGLFLAASLAVTVGDDLARKEEIAALRLELNRNLHGIEDVEINFLIQLPMDKPALAKHVDRISAIVHSQVPSQEPVSQWLIAVPFGNKSPLHPILEIEHTAYTFLSIVSMGVELFADSAEAEAFVPMAGPSQGLVT